jgi:hypothetical protein
MSEAYGFEQAPSKRGSGGHSGRLCGPRATGTLVAVPAQGDPMARAKVDRIIARVTPWSGVQVLVPDDSGDSEKNDQSAVTEPRRAPDKLHVSVRLTALTADGALVTSDRDDFGITLPRHVPRRHRSRATASAIENVTRDIEESINQMLGRDPKLHRPPRLAWGGLIDALAGTDIVVTEQELIDAPLTIELSPETKAQTA